MVSNSTQDKQPIVIDTMADFKRHGYSLATFCDECSRYHQFDIDELVANGHEETSILNIKPRCNECGRRTQKLVSPKRAIFGGYPR
jgi:hypothetical protein